MRSWTRLVVDDVLVMLRPIGTASSPARYEVLRDVVGEMPVLAGEVYKSKRTWERRSKGARYVNARGTSPCWRNTKSALDFDTRKAAAEALVRGEGGTT